MIQQLIYDRFGVLYKVFYIAQLLKNLGFSYQKRRLSPIIWTQISATLGVPRRGPRWYVSPKSARLCCSL